MTYTQIALDIDGPIATITLDRPEKLNAFTGVMMTEIIAAFDETDANDQVKAVIVTGRGRAFSAPALPPSIMKNWAAPAAPIRCRTMAASTGLTRPPATAAAR
jgi:enoyl-CoA hydratase/carnithine racemase